MKKFWNEQTTFVKLIIIIIGLGFLVYLVAAVIKPAIEGFYFWNKTDYEKSAQIGDYLAGAVGTLFAFAGTIFIILTFREQNRETKRKRFEEIFYEMVRIHRENVSQMIYFKKNQNNKREFKNRQVIKEIVDEYKELYGDFRKLVKRWDLQDSLSDSYKDRTNKIISANNLKTSVLEMLTIDLTYHILFYGLGQEGKVIIEGKFKSIIKPKELKIILFYLEQKPKKSNSERFEFWKELKTLESKTMLNSVLASYGREIKDVKFEKTIADKLKANREYNLKYKKYYGGHQHRLGHYYRHLYQSYKMLDRTNLISENSKYDYSKLIRAQISTYEQILLFINSLSSLGMKWQLIEDNDKKNNFIENYQVIKNVPGLKLYEIKYKNFYRNIQYEFVDQ